MHRLNTHALPDLSNDEAARIKAETGNNLRFEVRRRTVLGSDGQVATIRVRTPVIINDRYLKPDTEIETEAGTMTLEAFWGSDHQKLRCESTFRESSSMNGILSRHSDFAPFLFDNGTRIKYVLPEDELRRRMPDAWISRLSNMSDEEILERWTASLRSMDASMRSRVRDWVHMRTKEGKQELNATLKAADDAWKQESIRAANDNMLADIEAEGRQRIIYEPANLPDIVRQVEDAVFADRRNDLVLTHTQGLVTVCEKRPTTVREVIRENNAEDVENPLGLLIGRYGQHEFGLRLMDSCAFLKRADSGVLTEIPTPPKLVHTMLEVSYKRAQALVGIIEHPAVKSDGTLVSGLMFDPNTGFFTRVANDLVPDLPDKITKEMAAESYRWICVEALADFPFATELDRAGAVAMILTAIQRRLMTGSEGAPMFATSAPVQSSGKTALVRLMSYLVQGVGLPVTSWPSNDEEMGKHLLAILMEGLPIVLFDNLPEGGRIESDELAKACTAEKYRRRILGENREGEAPTNVVWCFTGNNIQPVGDFNTRTISIYLDANCENPDRRSYARDDIEAWCLEHRAKFFYHSLVILAGYCRQLLAMQKKGSRNKRDQCEPTRFQDWDRQVREPMLWAGAPDPALLFERNKSEDPQKEGREVLLETWFDVYGSEPVQLKQILDDCSRSYSVASNKGLREAISDLVQVGRLNSKSFSSLLQKFVNQWLGDYRLRKAPQSANSNTSAKWFVERRQGERHADD
jgi:hypothetical protein